MANADALGGLGQGDGKVAPDWRTETITERHDITEEKLGRNKTYIFPVP
jgi:hypothetical protein